MGTSVKFEIFDSQILPILIYGSEIWSTESEIVLECVQQLLGIKPQTSMLTVYGETSHFPLVLRQRLNVVKYWPIDLEDIGQGEKHYMRHTL